jgi:hypothetical protein
MNEDSFEVCCMPRPRRADVPALRRAYGVLRVQPGELEEAMGRSLALFIDVSNYCERCNAVVMGIIHQLASLFDEHSRLSAGYRGVSLIPVYKALGSVLQVCFAYVSASQSPKMPGLVASSQRAVCCVAVCRRSSRSTPSL